MNIILASSSVYRKELLLRLNIPFSCTTPDVDESRLINEPIEAMVERLAKLKAQKIGDLHPNSLCIGSDTAAMMGDVLLGKPRDEQDAFNQLQSMSGQDVVFLTGVACYLSKSKRMVYEQVPSYVRFKHLKDEHILRYLELEKPYQSTASFKSETSACGLISSLRSDDPTAIIGLPLIRLVDMLEVCGVSVFDEL